MENEFGLETFEHTGIEELGKRLQWHNPSDVLRLILHL